MLTAFVFAAFVGQFAGADAGELRVVVTDGQGLALKSAVAIESDASGVRRQVETDPAGVATARRLPFGKYRVRVTRDGFAASDGLVEIRTAVPTEYRVTLALAAVAATVDVAPDATLVDQRQTTTVRQVGAELMRRRTTALPGRALPDLINTQPGWLLEAGGTLHPRGSEVQTQFVVDGLPLTDNRAPGFAPEFDADSIHALGILTGGYPAEYGRKLGGVVEVATVADSRRGLHGAGGLSFGSFGTIGGDAALGYAGPRGSIGVSGGSSRTDRYLDPPVEENFTNEGRTSQVSVRAEAGRFGAIFRHADARFMVPNEAEQEEAGQRQQRTARETGLTLSYQHILSASAVASVHGMIRDLDAGLTSNDRATPIFAEQSRGLQDGYVKGTIAWHRGAHEWKAGGDTSVARLREAFNYRITDPSAFDDDIQPVFTFADRGTDREHALFVQDQIAAGPWTVKAGLRWDSYSLMVKDDAFSPRLAVAWSPDPSLAVRASYDRAFQTPAVENLLLASSADVDSIGDDVLRRPVLASRGDFFEAAVTKALGGAARIGASVFHRRMGDFADDEQLLNTGVSFPVTFARGTVDGAEFTLDIRPAHRSLGEGGKRLSGSLSYSWMRGEAELPITGGLLLGDEDDLGEPGDTFPISQDQRHTVRGRIAAQVTARSWVALAVAGDSGLPFEFEGDPEDAEDQFSARILEQVNFETGRVRPSVVFDASAGFEVGKIGGGRLHAQVDVRNVTNRLRVINFAGLFSGTALAPPRSVAVRLRIEF